MDGNAVGMLLTSVLLGVALAQLVLPAAIAERLPVGMRAAGVGLAFGVS